MIFKMSYMIGSFCTLLVDFFRGLKLLQKAQNISHHDMYDVSSFGLEIIAKGTKHIYLIFFFFSYQIILFLFYIYFFSLSRLINIGMITIFFYHFIDILKVFYQ